MKKILSILFVLMLIITLVQIRSMYALYKDKLSGEYSTSLGKWNVKVNGTDIVSPGDVVEFEMTDKNVSYDYTDGHILAGSNVIAPGTEAFFDILIDTQGTEVAVKYEIEFGETIEDAATNTTRVGQVTSYKLFDYDNSVYIVDDTDDDVDPATDDYDFAVPAPIKFEIVEVTESFGNYTRAASGQISGTAAPAGTYVGNATFDTTKNIAKGIIPVSASQTADVTNKVLVKFKWISDEASMTATEKAAVDAMYKYFADLNEENKIIEFAVPMKVKAIQYFGESL